MTLPLFSRSCAGAAGFVLLAGGLALLPGTALAQLNPQELLKQVLPGATGGGDTGDGAAAGERACQRYAEDQGLEVRRIVETRRSGTDDFEVTLSVEDRDDRYEARCIYDSGEREVVELETAQGSSAARSGDDDEVDERLARRARDACEDLAADRDLEDVDFEDVRARGRDTVEVRMRARVRGDRQDLTCLYDDDQRQARLAER